MPAGLEQRATTGSLVRPRRAKEKWLGEEDKREAEGPGRQSCVTAGAASQDEEAGAHRRWQAKPKPQGLPL